MNDVIMPNEKDQVMNYVLRYFDNIIKHALRQKNYE